MYLSTHFKTGPCFNSGARFFVGLCTYFRAIMKISQEIYLDIRNYFLFKDNFRWCNSIGYHDAPGLL